MRFKFSNWKSLSIFSNNLNIFLRIFSVKLTFYSMRILGSSFLNFENLPLILSLNKFLWICDVILSGVNSIFLFL